MLNELNEILSNITWNIYVTPLWCIGLAMLFLVSIWATAGNVGTKKCPRFWKFLNRFFLILSIGSILYVTLLTRSKEVYTPDYIPFSFIERAKVNKEVYRSVLMNVFLFVPFGLFTPYSFKRKNISKTYAWAILFSAGIEIVQLVFSLGMMATDDILANFFGAFIGSFAYILVSPNKKRKKRKSK